MYGNPVYSKSALPSELVCRLLDPSAVRCDRRRVRRFLKLRESSPSVEAVESMIEKSIDACREFMSPAYQYTVLRIDRVDLPHPNSGHRSGVHLQEDVFFDSRGLAKMLRNAKRVALFVLTLGQEIDGLIEDLTIDDFTAAFVLDGVASAYLHGVLQLLEDDLTALATANDLVLGRRFSPGFHQWDLPQQRRLFDVLDPESIGVQLSEYYFMTPKHSLSGALGLLPG
jgi:hypothetical protein